MWHEAWWVTWWQNNAADKLHPMCVKKSINLSANPWSAKITGILLAWNERLKEWIEWSMMSVLYVLLLLIMCHPSITSSIWERVVNYHVGYTLKWTSWKTIGVTYGGYGGYAYPPLFGVGGTVLPTFWRVIEKNNSHFPSSSAHVSPYNIQENVWRLGLRPRNCVDLHRRIFKKLYTREYIARRVHGPGGLDPQKEWKNIAHPF